MVSKKTGALMAANALYDHHHDHHDHHHHSHHDGRPSLPPTPIPMGHSPTLQPTNQIGHHPHHGGSPSYHYHGLEHSVMPYHPENFSYVPGKPDQDWAGYRGFEYDKLGRAELIGVFTKEVPRAQDPGSWFEEREDGRSDLPPVEVIVHEVRGNLPPVTETEAYLPELPIPEEPIVIPAQRRRPLRRIDGPPQRHIPTYTLPLRRATNEVILPVQHVGPLDFQPVPASPILRGRESSGHRAGYTVPEGRRTFGVPITNHRPSTPIAAPAPIPAPIPAPAPKKQTYEDVQQY